MPRVSCPITKAFFLDNSVSSELSIEGSPDHIQVNPTVFGTGSFGWKGEGALEMNIGGVPVLCSIHVNIVAKGSKG